MEDQSSQIFKLFQRQEKQPDALDSYFQEYYQMNSPQHSHPRPEEYLQDWLIPEFTSTPLPSEIIQKLEKEAIHRLNLNKQNNTVNTVYSLGKTNKIIRKNIDSQFKQKSRIAHPRPTLPTLQGPTLPVLERPPLPILGRPPLPIHQPNEFDKKGVIAQISFYLFKTIKKMFRDNKEKEESEREKSKRLMEHLLQILRILQIPWYYNFQTFLYDNMCIWDHLGIRKWRKLSQGVHNGEILDQNQNESPYKNKKELYALHFLFLKILNQDYSDYIETQKFKISISDNLPEQIIQEKLKSYRKEIETLEFEILQNIRKLELNFQFSGQQISFLNDLKFVQYKRKQDFVPKSSRSSGEVQIGEFLNLS